MRYITLFILFFIEISIFADGLMVPLEDEYPYDILRNKITSVQVEIHDLISETTVYQVFQNEWGDTVDAVYAFPLPQGARAIRLQYSVQDTLIDAVLKVKQQSTTPGTGEGGTVASINKYMGSNVIKLSVSDIAPYGVKAIQLSYISSLIQYDGQYEYTFPLDTREFVNQPLDYLSFDLKVHASDKISSFGLESHPDYLTIVSTDSEIHINMVKSKAYANTDIVFNYGVESDSLQVSLFTWNPDSTDGYFALVGHPQKEAADTALPSHIVFLLCNSNTMIGNKLNQSKRAIGMALDQLDANDHYRVLLYNAVAESVDAEFRQATPSNIADTKSILESIETASGNRLDIGLQYSLAAIPAQAALSSIVAFSDGKSPGDPAQIESSNIHMTGIHFIAIGEEVNRFTLEAIASRNYGYVAYLNEDDLLAEEMIKTVKRISQPIMKSIDLTFDDPGVYSMYPKKFPAIYAGTDFMVSGRFTTPGAAMLLLEGLDHQGLNQYSFSVNFIDNFELTRQIWAKAAIDHLEATILIEGESDTLKNELIGLSLDHNIRCRYTAFEQNEYYGDDTKWTTTTDETGIDYLPVRVLRLFDDHEAGSTFKGNYPNPFTTHTTLEFYIGDENGVESKFVYLYDISGKLIGIIDISQFGPGNHRILIHGSQLGSAAKGILLAYLVVEGKPVDTLKMLFK